MGHADLYCCIDEDAAERARAGIPDEKSVQTLSEIFRVFGDPTRIRILSVLASGPMCVTDLSALVGMQQTAVSHQLKVLRHNRLVKYRREGKLLIYSLDDAHVEALLSVGLEHVAGEQGVPA